MDDVLHNVGKLYVSYGPFLFLCAVIAAKWGLELGLSQFRQFLLFAVGFLLGPLVLVLQYIYLVYMYKEENRAGHQLFWPPTRKMYNEHTRDNMVDEAAS